MAFNWIEDAGYDIEAARKWCDVANGTRPHNKRTFGENLTHSVKRTALRIAIGNAIKGIKTLKGVLREEGVK